MDNLPREIFISIISNLNQKDICSCVQVSHKWFRIITSTTFYKKLEFKGLDQLHRAIPWFEANDHIGKQVQELGIIGCDIDLLLFQSLPTLFPNIKQLQWHEEQQQQISTNSMIEDMKSNSAVIELDCNKKWNHLESIIDMPKSLHISNVLLSSGMLPHLKHLEVSFHYSVSSQDNINLLKSLIKKLPNAPTLKKLALGKVQVSLKDLEDLHKNTPQLQELQLCDALLTNEEIDLQDIQPTKEFKSFHFMPRNASHLRDEKNVSSIVKWFEYMGKKYTHLRHLTVLANNKKLPQSDSIGLENSLIQALSNMPNIETFIMELCPISDGILSILNQNNVHLKKMNLALESEESLQDDCSLIQLAKSTQSIESLQVSGTPTCDIYDDFIITHYVIGLSINLNNLKELKISNIPAQNRN